MRQLQGMGGMVPQSDELSDVEAHRVQLLHVEAQLAVVDCIVLG